MPLTRPRRLVRLVLGITLLLLGAAMLLVRVEGSAGTRPIQPARGQWVRTVNGWERTDLWHEKVAGPPQLHPLVVAAGQGLVSVLGLVAASRRKH
jgi:hypothetical protein